MPSLSPAPDGILLVDKPTGWTSHDVVSRTRRLAGTRKVGHAGTLDPMATGLLVLGLGPSTRLLTYLVGLDKTYEATIRLGQSTTTEDAEGEVLVTAPADAVAALSRDRLDAAVVALTGPQQQVPSSVSAIKVDGRRAYDRVRAGEDVVLKPRSVTITAFEVRDVRAAITEQGAAVLDADVSVSCTSGTYVRALARDLGAALEVGGHLTALRRSRVGPFGLAEARPLDSFDDDHPVAEAFLRPAAVASALFPRVDLDAAEARDLGHGKSIPIALEGDPAGRRGPIAAVGPGEDLVGLVSVTAGRSRVLVNFPTEARSGGDA